VAKTSTASVKLSAEGQRTITAYFRDSKADTVPWGPATTTLFYDKTAPVMPKTTNLAGSYSGTNFTVTFKALASDVNGKKVGSGVKEYVLVYNPAKSTKSKCVSDTALPITYSTDGTTGKATLTIATPDLVKKHKFRLCARDNAGNTAAGLTLTGKP
jgi:hypothetical protein